MLYRLYLLAVCTRDENYGERSWKSSGFIHPCTNVLYFGFCRHFISMIKIYNINICINVCTKSPLQQKHKPPISITAKNRKESLSSQSDITQESTLISHPRAFSWLLKCVSIFGHNFHIIRNDILWEYVYVVWYPTMKACAYNLNIQISILHTIYIYMFIRTVVSPDDLSIINTPKHT